MIPVVGASGAVAAVLGGYAVTYPSAKVRTLIFSSSSTIVDLPALVCWESGSCCRTGLRRHRLVGRRIEPVAFWAHIGGFVAGMVLMPLLSLGASPPGTDWRKETDEMFRFDDPRCVNVGIPRLWPAAHCEKSIRRSTCRVISRRGTNCRGRGMRRSVRSRRPARSRSRQRQGTVPCSRRRRRARSTIFWASRSHANTPASPPPDWPSAASQTPSSSTAMPSDYSAELFPDNSLAAVHVYFPDPWWKKRHHKRRVMNERFARRCRPHARPRRTLHYWTDVEEYFEATLALIAATRRSSAPYQSPKSRPSTTSTIAPTSSAACVSMGNPSTAEFRK